jgi:hypothetical protein
MLAAVDSLVFRRSAAIDRPWCQGSDRSSLDLLRFCGAMGGSSPSKPD